MQTVAVNFWINREKLFKNGRYIIYENDKIVIFQKGHGKLPEDNLWVESKENKVIEPIFGIFSSKFINYWRDVVSKGARDNSIELKVGEDFKLKIDYLTPSMGNNLGWERYKYRQSHEQQDKLVKWNDKAGVLPPFKYLYNHPYGGD